MPRTALILAVLAGATTGCGSDQLRSNPEPDPVTIQIGAESFTLDVASDDATRIRGLKGVTEIDPSGGMIFIFPSSGVRSFWMSDCLVDIDVMFLDPRGRVSAVHTMRVELPRRADESRSAYEQRLKHYSSVYPAQFAVEFRAGTLERLGVTIDRKIPLDLPRLKAAAR